MTRWKYRDSTGTDREGELVDFMEEQMLLTSIDEMMERLML